MKIFFDHIQKTGGTSLYSFFVEAFGENEVSPQLFGHSPRSALLLYGGRKVVNGHFGFIEGESLPHDRVAVTILRDPRNRILSLYSELRDVPDHGLPMSSTLRKDQKLEDLILDVDYRNLFSNTQAKHYASFFHRAPQSLPLEEMLRLAKMGLDQYQIVGTTEQLSAFVDLLRTSFLIPESCLLPRTHVTVRRIRYEELSPETQAFIDEHNQVDLELWAYAASLFDSNMRKFISFSSQRRPVGQAPQEAEAGSHGQADFTSEDGSFTFLGASVKGALSQREEILSGETAVLYVSFRADQEIENLSIGYRIEHDSGLHIFGIDSFQMGAMIHCQPGEYFISFSFPAHLALGIYFISIEGKVVAKTRDVFFLKRVAKFTVAGFLDHAFEGLVRLVPVLSHGVSGQGGEIEVKTTRSVKHLGRLGRPVADTRGRLAAMETLTMRKDQYVAVPITIHNEGAEEWYGDGTMPCCVSYHWKDMNGETVVHDGVRTSLPGSVLPGGSLEALASVMAPDQYGQYLLEITMVQEDVCWFELAQFTTALVRVDVAPRS